MGEPVWTAWAIERPTEAGVYWWRQPAEQYGELVLRPEWHERVDFHGMGVRDAELWPAFSYWDGYNRAVPNGLEWRRPSEAEAASVRTLYYRVAVPGVKPCPFCGGAPTVQAEDRLESGSARLYSAVFRPNRFWITCCAVKTGVYRLPQEVCEVWNKRAPIDGVVVPAKLTPEMRFAMSIQIPNHYGHLDNAWLDALASRPGASE